MCGDLGKCSDRFMINHFQRENRLSMIIDSQALNSALSESAIGMVERGLISWGIYMSLLMFWCGPRCVGDRMSDNSAYLGSCILSSPRSRVLFVIGAKYNAIQCTGWLWWKWRVLEILGPRWGSQLICNLAWTSDDLDREKTVNTHAWTTFLIVGSPFCSPT